MPVISEGINIITTTDTYTFDREGTATFRLIGGGGGGHGGRTGEQTSGGGGGGGSYISFSMVVDSVILELSFGLTIGTGGVGGTVDVAGDAGTETIVLQSENAVTITAGGGGGGGAADPWNGGNRGEPTYDFSLLSSNLTLIADEYGGYGGSSGEESDLGGGGGGAGGENGLGADGSGLDGGLGAGEYSGDGGAGTSEATGSNGSDYGGGGGGGGEVHEGYNGANGIIIVTFTATVEASSTIPYSTIVSSREFNYEGPTILGIHQPLGGSETERNDAKIVRTTCPSGFNNRYEVTDYLIGSGTFGSERQRATYLTMKNVRSI